jgi:DNA-binding response OmpR family regulator/predicted hydrocarbon binding protein
MVERDLVYVVHPTPAVAAKLSGGLKAAEFEVVSMTSVDQAQSITDARQFDLPDAILTPLADVESGDSILISLYRSNPLMEQIPLVVVASSEADERRRALRMGLLSVVLPPYDGEEVSLTTKLAIEKHRSDQLLFGSLTQLSAPDLLQTAEAGRRSGTVTFRHNNDKGTIWMRDGFIIDAEVENDCRGEEAVYIMVVWDTGTFEANFGGVDVEERFKKPPSTLLLEAMRRFDEESASTVPIPVIDEVDNEVLDLCLVLLNVIAGYGLNHLHPSLIHKRLENSWRTLAVEHPQLEAFYVTEEGTVMMAGATPADLDAKDLVRAVGKLVAEFFETMDEALAWRFTPQRLARLLAPWREQLREYGFLEEMGIADTVEDPEEETHASTGVAGKPVPVGCLVVNGEGVVEAFSPYGPRIGRLEQSVVVGRSLNEILPTNLAALADRLTRQIIDRDDDADGLAIGREVMQVGHQQHVVRTAVIRPASKRGFVVAINRLRDQRRSLSPEIERDPLTGSLRDSQSDRLLVANQDFLQAFEGLFAKSLRHRHHELLQRFGKKWGLRHAMRLEHMVQRDYRMTLREMESQMALEMMSGSVGVFGLGRFDAVLDYRDSGLIVIHHQASPFPGIFETTASGACSILSGFHAAILSYLAGRNLAAREVRCSVEPGDPCIFVVGTEERLTKLLIAIPGSPDNQLLQEITRRADAGGAS